MDAVFLMKQNSSDFSGATMHSVSYVNQRTSTANLAHSIEKILVGMRSLPFSLNGPVG